MKMLKLQAVANFAIAEAKRLGATDAEITMSVGDSVSIGVRQGEVEELTGAQSQGLTFRAFVGQRHATVSSSDFRKRSMTKLVRDTIALAKVSEEDPSAGLADPEHLAREFPELNLFDASVSSLSVADKIRLAKECEAAALGENKLVTNSEGAGFSDSRGILVKANSRGFSGAYQSSHCSLSASAIASDGESMQVGSWYTQGRKPADLEDAASVGRVAAQHALRQLGARRVKSQNVPVVFDPSMAARLVGQFVGAAHGSHVYRKSSFLADKLGQQVASPLVTIVDDPLIPGGLGSRPFDSEGLVSARREIVAAGKLACYLINVYGGRMLKTAPNGGSTSNLYLKAGTLSPEEIIASIPNGLYLTSVSGPGFNATTGDYSVGASGMWIENGKLAFPVDNITIASNVADMFGGIVAVGNDLVFRGGTNSPTIMIKSMTVAGE